MNGQIQDQQDLSQHNLRQRGEQCRWERTPPRHGPHQISLQNSDTIADVKTSVFSHTTTYPPTDELRVCKRINGPTVNYSRNEGYTASVMHRHRTSHDNPKHSLSATETAADGWSNAEKLG